MSRNALQVLVVDLSRDQQRVIRRELIPGLKDHLAAFRSGCLFEVPPKLGWGTLHGAGYPQPDAASLLG
jgi:hypothetical protein